MRIAFDGKQFRGSYVTGPTHNYLGLTLVLGADADWVLEEKAMAGEDRILNPSEVRVWVSDGVAQGNAEFAESFGIARGEYVISDSVAPAIYRHIAKTMVRAAHEATQLILQICLSANASAGEPIPASTFMELAKKEGHKSGDAVDALEYCRSVGWIEAGPGGSVVLTEAGAAKLSRAS